MPFALLGQCDGFEPGPYSATLLGNATLNDLPGEVGDELAAYDLDGACLGRAELITFEGLSFFNLTVYGDDPVSSEDEGLMPGDVFVLEYHDVSSGEVHLFGNGTTISGWTNVNGAPLPGWSDPYQTLPFFSNYTCPGDIDTSGAVEVSDLLDLLSAYGQSCFGCRADLDGDGLVQVNDLLNLLSFYGSTC